MDTYNNKIRAFVDQYIEETGNPEVQLPEVSQWAIRKRLWQAPIVNQADILARDLAKALREDHFIDNQGRKVRSKHPVRQVVTDVNGDQKTMVFWADIRQASRDHMLMSFQQRRSGILGDCKQLKRDVGSYNDNYNPGEEIQTVFDFTHDIEEDELSGDE